VPAFYGYVDSAALLAALAEIESGNRSSAIGRYGERSAFQFTLATWRQHTRTDFERATSDPAYALAVARERLLYLRRVLLQRNLLITPATLAAAWHYGPDSAKVCSDTDYVRRVVALYHDALRRSVKP
jgi:hypothetical protein